MESDKILGKLKVVKITDINFGDRRRIDYGDIKDLANSIKERGLIHPIAVQSDNGEPPFILAAGGRRFLACASLELDSITCRVYDHPLTATELRAIELYENLDRKELDFVAECRLKRDINIVLISMKGEKISTSPNADGWSMTDTAEVLGVSKSGLSGDIKLAEAIDKLPELELDKCKDKSEAIKKLASFDKQMLRAELSKRAENFMGDNPLRKKIDAYIVKDFFEGIKETPNEVIDLVELDPPYGISLQSKKKGSYDAIYGDSYNEIDKSYYLGFMSKTLTECYRVMKPNSWLILWFGIEPWIEDIYNLLIQTGFQTRRLVGMWTKGNGQTMQPHIYLANCYEPFFYARKGNAEIVKKGRSNVFDFPPVPPQSKIHPTERPYALIKEVLETFALENSNVLVPFLGSGKTLRVAFDLKMIPYGFDLTKEYKDAYVTNILREGEIL